MALVLNTPGFCIRQSSEYASSSEYARILNIPGFWIYQNCEYTRVLNMLRFLRWLWFWIWQGFEYTRITQDPGRAWIMLHYVLICLNMPECAWICVNMPKSARVVSVLHVPIVTPCLLKRVVTYFNGFQPLIDFAKNSIFTKRSNLNVWQGFDYASAYIESRQPILQNCYQILYLCSCRSNILYFQTV